MLKNIEISNEIDVLEILVGLRFKTKKDIVLTYRELLFEYLKIGNIEIINDERNLEENKSFLTIPVNKTRYENESEMDFNLIFTLNIVDGPFIDIDLYYLKDNAGQYYITEFGYEYQ